MKDELAKVTSDIQFENDFGQEALGLGRLTQDQGVIAVSSLVGAFVGAAIAGLPLAAIVLLVGLNDIMSANKLHKQKPEAEPSDRPSQPPVELIGQNTKLGAIEVKAEIVSDRPLPPFDRSRIIVESKGLMIIGDMGAAKTCVAQYIANGFQGYGVIVFDPHGKTDWGNAYVLTKMPAIYQQMRILLDVLEDGDESPLLVICDEWLEIRGDRLNKSGDHKGLADDFIRLFSTKPRKFNKLAAFVLHSPNVEAAGVDSFLRENYLKVYLGKLVKKEYPTSRDCAYLCMIDGDQFEHPTHGHHATFRPNGNAPRNLQAIASAPISIPLAYMDGREARIHVGGWADGSFCNPSDVRMRLESLLSDSGIDTGNDTRIRQKDLRNGDTGTDTGIDTSDTEPDTSDTANAGSTGNTGGSSDTGRDTSDTITPARIPRHQALQLIDQMKLSGLSQTQIIQSLWGCEKNKAGWKQAYSQFKELAGGDDE